MIRWQPMREVIVHEAFGYASVGYIFRIVLEKYLPFLAPGEIGKGPLLTQYLVRYQSARDVFDKLAELAGGKWWVDNDLCVHFKLGR